MRNVRRIGLALLMALALAMPAYAQADDRLSFNAAVGPSFATVGTTLSTTAGMDLKLNERVGLVGEFGFMRHAAIDRAAEIAPPVPGLDVNTSRVNAYHWNGNVKVRPYTFGSVMPYVTAGVGAFTADTVTRDVMVGTTRFEDRRRGTDLATNVGAGLNYRFNDWIGVGADYRTFFIHRDGSTPRVDRLTAGLTFSVR